MAALAASGTLATLLIVYLLLFADPLWYDPPEVPARQRQAVRDRLLAAEQHFTDSLITGRGTFVYHVYQEDVNRWLAMRQDIFPLAEDYLPPEVTDPFLLFDSGRVTLAVRYRGRVGSAVLSVDTEVDFRDGGLWLKAEKLRCGSIPLALNWAEQLLAEPVDRSAGDLWDGSPPAVGSLLKGLRIGADARWKNGGIRYRVLNCAVREGVIDLTIEPLGR